MSIPTYIPNYPPDGSSLGQTKSVIRNNLDGTFETIGIDHFNQNGQNTTFPSLTSPPGSPGYHADIHMVPVGTWNPVTRTGAPTAISGVNQLFSMLWTPSYAGATADTQLFNRTGNGTGNSGIAQLTGLNENSEGWAWMGGALVQWGTVSTAVNTSGNVVFSSRSAQGIDFPSSAWVVICSNISSGGVSSATSVFTFHLTTTGFGWNVTQGSSNFAGFNWVAIGQ